MQVPNTASPPVRDWSPIEALDGTQLPQSSEYGRGHEVGSSTLTAGERCESRIWNIANPGAFTARALCTRRLHLHCLATLL